MKEKNLAIELLKRLLTDQISISIYQRTNLVQSERFSELLSRVISSYLKGMLTNKQVIKELPAN